MAETVCWKPPKFRAHRLTVFNRQGYQREYELEGRKSLGRFTACPQPDIVLSSGIVSRSHGEFGVLEGRCFYRSDFNARPGPDVDVTARSFSVTFSFLAIFQVLQCVFLIFHVFQ